MPLSRLPLDAVLPTTMVVCVGAGVPAILVAVGVPSTGNEAAYLSVTSGLLGIAGGLTCLVAWRIVGRAFPGRLGAALVVLGALTIVESALSRFGAQVVPGSRPLDQLVIVGVTGWLIARGLWAPEVDAGFDPLVTLVVVIGVATLALGVLQVLQARQLLPSVLAEPEAHVVLQAIATAIWLAVALATARGRPDQETAARSRVAPVWVTGVALVLAVAAAAFASTPFAPWWSVVAAVVELFGLALAFGASLGQVQELLRGEDRRQLHLGRALHDTRRQAAIEREALEELLHDLRNAVAALRAADAVLRQSGSTADVPAQVELAEAVTAEIARLEVMVDPQPRLQACDVQLASVLGPVVLAERLLGARIEVRVADLGVRADRECLGDVVRNLLANARRYAPGTRVTVSARRAGPTVELSVHDEGPGIPPHEHAAVFERGVRGSTSAGTDGSGLGLYVARKLVTSMGGDLRLAADGAPGARFVLTLPAGELGAQVAGAPPAEDRGAGHVVGGSLRAVS